MRGRIVVSLVALGALIIFGILQFDQALATVALYLRLPGATVGITQLPFGTPNLWFRAAANIFLVVLFLVLIPVRSPRSWEAHGAYTGFMVSLFSEMFGFPLTIFLLAGLGYSYFEPQFIGYVALYGQVIGSPIAIAGLILIYLGWKEIFLERTDRLITRGIYRNSRHPQYLGLILVTLGQLIVWPTIPTAIMWPVLTLLYYRQAKREEALLLDRYGKEFEEYAQRTPMFIPRIGALHRSGTTRG